MPITGIVRNDKSLMVMDPFYKSFVRHDGKPGRNKAPRVPINLMNLALRVHREYARTYSGGMPKNAPDESKGSSPMIRTQSVLPQHGIVGKVGPWRIVGQTMSLQENQLNRGLSCWGKAFLLTSKQPSAHLKIKGG